MAMTVEADRVQVDPSQSPGRQLDPRRAPVGLDLIAESAKRRERRSFLLGIDREVQIAILAGLPAHERGNAPAPCNPGSDIPPAPTPRAPQRLIRAASTNCLACRRIGHSVAASGRARLQRGVELGMACESRLDLRFTPRVRSSRSRSATWCAETSPVMSTRARPRRERRRVPRAEPW